MLPGPSQGSWHLAFSAEAAELTCVDFDLELVEGVAHGEALDAERSVSWEYYADVVSAVKDMKARRYQIVPLEQTDASFDYRNFEAKQPICLVLGNEIEGVSDDLLRLADRAMEIPMHGIKNSLNVSVACGIAVYHISHSLREHMHV